MTSVSIAAKPASAVQLAEFPIPGELVAEGKPLARIWVAAQSADLKVTQGVWDCTAGRFNWDYTWDEFVQILEGEMHIAEEGGKSYTLRAGDFAHFPAGLKARWHVPKYVKKHFVLRTPEPLKL